MKCLLKKITPRVGLEPTTPRLTAVCSTIELSRNIYVILIRHRMDVNTFSTSFFLFVDFFVEFYFEWFSNILVEFKKSLCYNQVRAVFMVTMLQLWRNWHTR